MRIIELYGQKAPLLSLEIFPPRMAYPLESVFDTVKELKKLNPAYISVTYGAGGSNRERTVEIAARVKKEYGIEAQAHLTCIGHRQEDIKNILARLNSEGICNIMALRGDIPEDEPEFDFRRQEYHYAFELIRDIRAAYGDSFGIAAAAHPEGHPECPRLKDDIFHLKNKVDNGVDFLITQLFFDNRIFFDFWERCQAMGINCPVIPGIMPVLNAGQIKRMIYLCGASMPARLLKLVDKYEKEPASMEKAGIDYASQQIKELLENAVAGVHLYSMNKPRQISEIVYNIGLASPGKY